MNNMNYLLHLQDFRRFLKKTTFLYIFLIQNGSVNFNLLQSVLHIVVQQLELVQCQVEFRGKDGEKVQNLMSALKPETSVKITEFVVTPIKDAGKVLNRRHTPRGIISSNQIC